MPTESDHLLADGIPVAFADGIHYLRFPMRALKQLEDSFNGDLDNVLGFFAEPNDHFVGRLTTILAIGLAHEGYDLDKVLDEAIGAKMAEYNEAALAAFLLALPPAAGDDEEGDSGEGKAGGPSGSTGPGSITPPPSGLAAAMTSSGSA